MRRLDGSGRQPDRGQECWDKALTTHEFPSFLIFRTRAYRFGPYLDSYTFGLESLSRIRGRFLLYRVIGGILHSISLILVKRRERRVDALRAGRRKAQQTREFRLRLLFTVQTLW